MQELSTCKLAEIIVEKILSDCVVYANQSGFFTFKGVVEMYTLQPLN